jgi:uncharacterized repeat protein (TIGR04138 family)
MLDPSHPLARLMQRDRRYKLDAYAFVQDALLFAHERLGLGHEEVSVHEEPAEPDPEKQPSTDRHLTGQELCEAIRILALKEFGYMAKSVFNSWGVHGTRDFGNVVFNLIEIGNWKKTEQDRIEDFDDVFDFDVALKQNFSIGPSESKHG